MSDTIEREYIGEVASNFDHVIDEAIAERLKNEPNTYAEYPAWNFHGTVWYDTDRYKCKIMVHHVDQGVIESNSVKGIMAQASETYGAD